MATLGLFRTVLTCIATVIGIAMVSEYVDAKTEQRLRTEPFGTRNAGCQICGRGYAYFWVGAQTWRCPLHPPETRRF